MVKWGLVYYDNTVALLTFSGLPHYPRLSCFLPTWLGSRFAALAAQVGVKNTPRSSWKITRPDAMTSRDKDTGKIGGRWTVANDRWVSQTTNAWWCFWPGRVSKFLAMIKIRVGEIHNCVCWSTPIWLANIAGFAAQSLIFSLVQFSFLALNSPTFWYLLVV